MSNNEGDWLWTRLAEAGRMEDPAATVMTVAQLLACRTSVRSLSLNEALWRLDRAAALDSCFQRHFVEQEQQPCDSVVRDQSTGCCDGGTEKDTTRRNGHFAMKALLKVPSTYETPWKAACIYIAYLQRNETGGSSTSRLRSSIVDVQCFVQQVVAAWWDEERRVTTASSDRSKRRRRQQPIPEGKQSEQTPRYWILRLVSVTIHPFRYSVSGCSTETRQANLEDAVGRKERWSVPLELVSTIVSLMHGLDTQLTHQSLDLIFSCERIQSNFLVPWVCLASELRLFLRDEDWVVVYSNLHETLEQLSSRPTLDPLTRTEWITLTETILSLSVAGACTARIQPHLWPGLMLQILKAVATFSTVSTYTSVEEALEANLSLLPSARLQALISSMASNHTIATAIIDTSLSSNVRFTKHWVEANLLLICMRASAKSRSRLVSQLIALTIYESTERNKTMTKKDNDECDLAALCLKRLQYLIIETLPEDSRLTVTPNPKRRRSVQSGILNVRQIFDGMMYSSHGRFAPKQSPRGCHFCDDLSRVSSLVFHSISVRATVGQDEMWLPYAMNRAASWAHYAREALLRPKAGKDVGVVLEMVIWITVYMEIPSLRAQMSQQMLDAFSSAFDFGVVQIGLLHSVVISVLISSVDLEDSGRSNNLAQSFEDHFPSLLSAQSVDLSLFSELAQVLSPLPSARRILLEISKSHLSRAFLHFDWSTTKDHWRTKSDTRIKCGLVAAITLLDMETWDDYELEACFFLSEIIVDNRPHIPLSARRWLFQTLTKTSHERRLNTRAALQLHKACLCRILCFFGANGIDVHSTFLFDTAFLSWEGDAPNQIEDVFGLFELTIALLQDETSDDIASNEKLRQTRRRYLDLLDFPRLPDGEDSMFAEDSCIPSKDDCHLGCLLTFFFLQELRAIPTILSHIPPPMHRELIKWVLDYVRDDSRQFPESEWMSTWLIQRTRHPCTPYAQHNLDRTQRAHIGVDYCDTVIDVLLGPIQSMCAAHNDGSSPKQYRSLLKMVFEKCGERRRFMAFLHETGETHPFDLFCHDRLTNRLDGFCATIIPLLTNVIEESGDPFCIDDILLAVVDLCEIVSLWIEQCHPVPGLKLVLRCLWQLHLCLSDEASAKSLVNTFERLCNAGSTSICRFPVHKLGDIDSLVRWVRKPVLCSMSTGFASYHRQIHDGLLYDEESLSLDFIVAALRHLLSDLVSGLEGPSGGLDYGLTLSLVDSITHLLMVLADMLEVSNSEEKLGRMELALFCTSAYDPLERILCNFALPVDIFKKIMLLFVVHFPSVARRARLPALQSDNSNQSLTTHSVTKLLFQLCSVLKRKVVMHKEPTTPWIAIAGSDHIADHDCDDISEISDGFVDCEESRTRIVSPNEMNISHTNAKASILLPSELSWVQSFCISFLALEAVWDGSRFVERSSMDHIHSFSAETCVVNLNQYHCICRSERNETLSSLESLFEVVTFESNVVDASGRVKAVFAQSLPLTAKVKCFAAISRIVLALLHSGRIVLSQISSDTTGQHFDNVDASFADAISCLLSWLSYRSDNPDIVSGIDRWSMSEMKEQKKIRGGVSSSGASICSRFPKLNSRLELLMNVLEDLMSAVKDCTRMFGKNNPHAFLVKIDHLIKPSEAEKPGKDFYTVLSDKLFLLRNERTQIDVDFGVTKGSEEVTAENPESVTQILRRVRQGSRKKVVRSRNKMLDAFLQLDRQTHMKEWDGDPFADLEDFIADE